MILILLATLLILGIAFYQVLQGLFSAIVTALLTILSAAIALNYYEPLAAMLYEHQPAHADALALMLLFFIPLIGLRFLYDNVFSGNVVMNPWADRIAGGALGLIIAMIVVGMLLIGLQMLPVGGKFLFYEPYNGALQREQRIWPFRPDEFTLGLADTLAAGGLGKQYGQGDEARRKRFSDVHPDLLFELYCFRNEAGVQAVPLAPTNAVRQLRVWRHRLDPEDPNSPTAVPLTQEELDRIPAYTRIPENEPRDLWIVRVAVDESVMDEDDWFRLPTTHFRLETADNVGYYPVTYLTYDPEDDPQWTVELPRDEDGKVIYIDRLEAVGELVVARHEDQLQDGLLYIDWVYQLPAGVEPDELIFRRVAVEPIRKIQSEPMSPADAALALDRNGKRFMARYERRR